ncbi:MAG: hypothetical protein ABH814_01015 [bacterium]
MTSLKSAVKRTFCYFEIFNYSPSQEEIYRYLIGTKCSLPDLRPFVRHCPKKQVPSALLVEKLCTANRLAVLASKMPGVRAVFLTGDLAAGGAKETSDADFMVITRQGGLFLVRLGLTVLFSLTLKRRSRYHPLIGLISHIRPIKTFACFNIFFEEESLSMPKERQNLFVAQEIARVKPLVDKGEYYQKFLSANRWILEFLPNFVESAQPPAHPGQSVLEHVASKNAVSGSRIFAVEGLQRITSKLKLAGKPVHANKTSLGGRAGGHPKQLFLHPKDLTSGILSLYKQNCQRAGVTPSKLYET